MTSEAPERTAAPSWTPRQRQVLDLLVRGYTNGQIGEALGISLDGAKWHVGEVMGKLGVDSREAAAAYWRAYNRPADRFSRAMRGLLLGSGLRWAAGTVGVTVAVAAAVALVFSLGGDDDQQATPDETPPATSTANATSTPDPTSTPEPAPTPDVGWTSAAVQVLTRGESVAGDYGLLYLDPATGGGRFWPLPSGAFVEVASPSGRWVIWGERTDSMGSLAWHLLDTAKNTTRRIELDGVPATHAVGYSPDESQMVVFAGRRAAVVETATGRVITEFPEADRSTSFFGGFTMPARWSADGSALAVHSSSVVHVVQDSVEQIEVPVWNIQWSRTGFKLAIAGPEGTLIRDFATASEVRLSAPGLNPRWSPDDRYIAVVAAGEELEWPAGHVARVFEAATGQEVLRILGYPFCIGDYWRPDGSLPFVDGKAATVPGGELIDGPDLSDSQYRYQIGGTANSVRAVTGGMVAAEVQLSVGWAVPFSLDAVGHYSEDAPPAVVVGLGGKGLCNRLMASEVQKPPF